MARAIFLALLAANLVFFGLQMVTSKDQQANADAIDDIGVPLLSLVTEGSGNTDQAVLTQSATGNVAESDPSLVSRRCLSLGPFTDDDEVQAAQLSLGALGLTGERRRAQGQIWVGYWIFLPPGETRAEAQEQVEALRKRGVADIYIEPAGERENAVSLGVFSERSRAQRRFREIKALGFAPQIARRTRQGTVFWLDFVPDASVRIDPADFQVAAGRIIRLASRVCQQPGDQLE